MICVRRKRRSHFLNLIRLGEKCFFSLFSTLFMSTHVGSNPVVGTISKKPTVNSAVHPFEVGNEYSEVTLRHKHWTHIDNS